MLSLTAAWSPLVIWQEMAEAEGDAEKAEDLRLELDDLEDRAKELDNIRTSTISAIRWVNSRHVE